MMFTIHTLSFSYGFCSKGEQWESRKAYPWRSILNLTTFLPIFPSKQNCYLLYAPGAHWGSTMLVIYVSIPLDRGGPPKGWRDRVIHCSLLTIQQNGHIRGDL